MKVHIYVLAVCSDKGLFRLTTSASSYQAAIEKVCKAENCPETAITRISKLQTINV